jgi:hypothetical protein
MNLNYDEKLILNGVVGIEANKKVDMVLISLNISLANTDDEMMKDSLTTLIGKLSVCSENEWILTLNEMPFDVPYLETDIDYFEEQSA